MEPVESVNMAGQNMNVNSPYQVNPQQQPSFQASTQQSQQSGHLSQQQQHLSTLQQQQTIQQQTHYMQNLSQTSGQNQSEIFNQQQMPHQLKQMHQQQQQSQHHLQQQAPQQHQQIGPILVGNSQLSQQQQHNIPSSQSILLQQIQSPGQRMPLNASKVISPQQQANMTGLSQGQQMAHMRQVTNQPQAAQQLMQSHTPPIVQAQTNPPSQHMGYNQMGQLQQQQQGQSAQSNIVVNKQIYSGGQQQQQQGYPYLQQPKTEKVWEGLIEWQEKDRNNPNSGNKVTHTVKARLASLINLDQTTGQYQTEVPLSMTQSLPQKLSMQLLSKQVLDILGQHCPTSSTKNLILYTENNQDLKTALSIGVNFNLYQKNLS